MDTIDNIRTLSHISSEGERERRHAALRQMMSDRGYDALVIWSRGDEFMRGRVQYVSDIFQWAGWSSVVFPSEGEATFVVDPLWGAARVPMVGWIHDVRITHNPGREISQILAARGILKGAIGVVGWADIATAAHMDELAESCPSAKLVDATDDFDSVRAIKSAEEVANIEETCLILRRVFHGLGAFIRPDVEERQVTAEAHRLCRLYGALDGIAQITTTPFQAYNFGTRRRIEPDDIIAIDLEWGGPSGYWAEVRRVFSFREPARDEWKYWQSRVAAFDACVQAMQVGASSDAISEARDLVYAEYGQTAAGLWAYTAHGIGIDSLEPPWVPGKERELEENMVINLHPAIRFEDPDEETRFSGIVISDNVLVTPDGPQRMTDQTDEWVILEH